MAKPVPSATAPSNGFLASLGRELAYAVEDIRHKVVEEGWFGRQVTPSTFPRDEPPMAPLNLYGPDGPGVHGPDAPTGGPLAGCGLEVKSSARRDRRRMTPCRRWAGRR